MIEVILADDHPLITQGISDLLANESGIAVSQVFRNGREVITYLEENRSSLPNVLLLDIDMPVMNGIACSKEVLSRFPSVHIGMLTMHSEKALISELMETGIKGYLLKTIDRNELLHAVKVIAEGKEYFTSDVTKALILPDRKPHPLNASPLLQTLSEREKEIVRLLATGLSNKEIGKKLSISHRTADTHRTNIMKKLGVKNVAGVIRFAFENGLA